MIIKNNRLVKLSNSLPEEDKILNRMMLTISSDIHYLILYNNIKMSDIAKELNITESKLKKYLSGTYNFDLKTLCKIEKIIGKQFIFSISEVDIQLRHNV